MSDGNFNRALLPHTPYGSGLKAGRAQQRMAAIEAFKAWLKEYQPSLEADEIEHQCDAFAIMMARRIRTS